MLLQRPHLLLLAAGAANAFRNTSPFLLLSSEPLDPDTTLQSAPLAKNDDLEDAIIDTFSSCDKSWFYIFTQQHVSSNDYRGDAWSNMAEKIGKADQKAVVDVPGVIGALDAERVRERIVEGCNRMGRKGVDAWPENEGEYRVVEMSLVDPSTHAESRAQAMRETDDALAPTVDAVLSGQQNAVLIYITTPAPPSSMEDAGDHKSYEMDDPYPSSMHTDLKRDLSARQDEGGSGEMMQEGLPLFEKYQFLTPGLFMTLFVSLLLLLILYVGISAIAGLEVSYMAFSKEMGPQAQKGKAQ